MINNPIELLQLIRYELWLRSDGECKCDNCVNGKRLMKMIDETLDNEGPKTTTETSVAANREAVRVQSMG